MTRRTTSRARTVRATKATETPRADLRVVAFPSTLGWIAAVVSGSADLLVHQLAFSHPSRARAIGKLDPQLLRGATKSTSEPTLEDAIEQYISGNPARLHQLRFVETARSPFARRVLAACRNIPYGQTRSYGELATAAGSPGAARAVGAVMAQNRLPLLIPCHRVIGSQGKLGGYSAPGGLETKVRLLNLEFAKIGRIGQPKMRIPAATQSRRNRS